MDSSQIQSLVEDSPFEATTASTLESYVMHQLKNKSYNFDANKVLLKNYQVNTNLMKKDIVFYVLILSLMRLPLTDFLALSYLVPYNIKNDPNIMLIQKCSDCLERGKFSEFWELYIRSAELFSIATGFVDSVRVYILGSLRDAFHNVAKPLFQESLGLDDASFEQFCVSNKFIEKVNRE